jgi:pimeloyl-ACP methyl ester carboxylesterase
MVDCSPAATDAQRREEARALAHLSLTELGKAARGVSKVHRSIAAGVFGTLGRTPLRTWSDPTRAVHDAISEGVYAATAGSLETAGGVAGSVVGGWGRPPSHTVPGALGIAVLNGLIGDELTASGSPLASSMQIWHGGRPVEPTVEALRSAFGAPSDVAAVPGHLVVFMHGLMETEIAWNAGEKPGYGPRLHEEIGACPVYVRYNSGRHISDNGRELDNLLSALVVCWPVPVHTLTLVGHSMGGLVVRSACHHASDGHSLWLRVLRHTVCLGSPHLGAPLARGVNAAAVALHTTPVTRPFANLLRRRSAGVRDLHHGTVLARDWEQNPDPDRWSQPMATDVWLSPHARHLYVIATVTRSTRHVVGKVVGDGLVLADSGRGRNKRRHVGYLADDGLHIGRSNHFTLLNDDTIYEWMRDRIRPQRAITA